MSEQSPIEVLAAFPEVRRLLIALLADLTDEQWARPTICAGWSVKDVALHLLGGNLANLSRRRDGFAGGLTPFVLPGEDPRAWDDLVRSLNRWNDAWVVAARRLSPRLLIELLDQIGAELETYYAGLDLLAPGDPVRWADDASSPVWLDVAREYTEQWIHQAQIRDAVAAPGLRDVPLFAPVLATLIYAVPRALAATPRPAGTAVRLRITGPAGGGWICQRLDERWALSPDTGQTAQAEVVIDQEAAWRWLSKGLSAVETSAATRLTGDRSLGKAVLRAVAIIA